MEKLKLIRVTKGIAAEKVQAQLQRGQHLRFKPRGIIEVWGVAENAKKRRKKK